jgi:UDP-N-acetylglucosamine acyltransferase
MNKVHETALISPKAILGDNNIIGAGVVIEHNVIMGDNNIISPYVTIGLPGEVRGENDIKGQVIIGNNNIVREFTSIQSPVRTDITKIGNHNYIMDKCHIGHDCILADNVTLAPFVCLGIAVLENWVNMGMGSVAHPRVTIGEGAMIGAQAMVKGDVPKYQTWVGVPAKFVKWNIRGMEKMGFTEEQIDKICASF